MSGDLASPEVPRVEAQRAPLLGPATLARLPGHVERPRYALDTVSIGIVHFGPGAFHRAHQGWYVDDLLAHDPRYGISAVSLRTPGLRDALAPQHGLYAVAVLDAEPRLRVIGALREALVASEAPSRVLMRLASPATRVVTATVTEKGYCLDGDGHLDLSHPDIRHDLGQPYAPRSLVGFLVEGLRLRRALGLRPWSVLSCDNLRENGPRLKRAVTTLAAARDSELARWIEAEANFPRTMVDSIVPASDDGLRERVARELGLVDRWPVQREAYLQWVVEDALGPDAPNLAAVGATLTGDVDGYATAKLRLLNGAHSTLAYLGLLEGHATVTEAMADLRLARHLERLMHEEIAPLVRAPSGLDLNRYIGTILQRFANPAIRHELAQIAWDGSQKLPIRILGTLRDALAVGRPVQGLCLTIAAWLHVLARRTRAGIAIVDPLADALADRARACRGLAESDLPVWFTLDQVFPDDLVAIPRFRDEMALAYDSLVTP